MYSVISPHEMGNSKPIHHPHKPQPERFLSFTAYILSNGKVWRELTGIPGTKFARVFIDRVRLSPEVAAVFVGTFPIET